MFILEIFSDKFAKGKTKRKAKEHRISIQKSGVKYQRKRLSSGKNLVEEMLANQETPMQLILNEESEAASTVVVPSSTPKKKVTCLLGENEQQKKKKKNVRKKESD